MGKYNGAVITAAGQNVIAQAITGTELTWTVMRTSSVAIPQGTDLTTLTSLSGIEQASIITDASVYGNNVIQLSSRFSNTGIATVYYIQTVGIYGQLAGGAETLIAVMTAVIPDEMPVYDPDSPSAFIFNTQITVQNANEVTMTVNDTGTATVADLNRKVDTQGGDISNTVVTTITTSAVAYPTVAAGDTVAAAVGKINKSISDLSGNKLDKTGDAANATIGSFSASSATYPVPAVGDSFKVILGKIIKFFGDIKSAVTSLSISGRTITWTKANGDSGTLTTQDTTYTAGTGLSLSGTKFNHSNSVTAGTAGTSSATTGYDTFAVPYVTYDAQGHVTAAGTHTHSLRGFNTETATENGNAGLVPAPPSINYPDRNFIFLAQTGWAYLPLQNNATTTDAHYALDARMGKTLNERISYYTDALGTIYSITPPAAMTISTTGLTNLMNTGQIPIGKYVIIAHVELGSTTDSTTLITRLQLYQEYNQQAIVEIHPFTKTATITFLHNVNNVGRYFIRVTANKTAEATADGARNYLRLMCITPV